MTATSRAMDHFFERTIPDAIEEQSGPVVRHMLKSRESFDIENTKLRAREAAIIAKFNVGRGCGVISHLAPSRAVQCVWMLAGALCSCIVVPWVWWVSWGAQSFCSSTAHRFEHEKEDRIRVFTALAEALDAAVRDAGWGLLCLRCLGVAFVMFRVFFSHFCCVLVVLVVRRTTMYGVLCCAVHERQSRGRTCAHGGGARCGESEAPGGEGRCPS